MIVMKCNGEKFAISPKRFVVLKDALAGYSMGGNGVDYGELKRIAEAGRTSQCVAGCRSYFDLDTMSEINAHGLVKRIYSAAA